MPSRDRLERRRPSRAPLPRFLIVCEGTKTEPGYFSHLRQSSRLPIDLVIEGGRTPKALVQKAVELKRRAEAEARRYHDSSLKFDEVWCVFDVDEHPFVPEAQQQARDNSIRVAISNPCFELWVLLHFQERTAYIHRHDVQNLCRGYLPKFQKDLPCDDLLSRRSTALQHAAALEKWQRERGNEGANPSTHVHHLVEVLLSVRAQS